jgi:hypothetical protein
MQVGGWQWVEYLPRPDPTLARPGYALDLDRRTKALPQPSKYSLPLKKNGAHYLGAALSLTAGGEGFYSPWDTERP